VGQAASHRPAPGAVLTGIPPVAALALILWNDFWLRPRFPGFWSGKLSDVGVAFLLPLFLVALWEWATWLVCLVRHRPFRSASRAVRVGACAVATAYYVCMELWPAFGRFHAAWLTLAWPWGAFRPGTADPTDLFALVTVPFAYVWMGVARSDPDTPDPSTGGPRPPSRVPA
jgi:hypothetical protein